MMTRDCLENETHIVVLQKFLYFVTFSQLRGTSRKGLREGEGGTKFYQSK